MIASGTGSSGSSGAPAFAMASNAASVAASLADAPPPPSTSNSSRINSSLLLLAATAVMVWEDGAAKIFRATWSAWRRVAGVVQRAALAVVGDAGECCPVVTPSSRLAIVGEARGKTRCNALTLASSKFRVTGRAGRCDMAVTAHGARGGRLGRPAGQPCSKLWQELRGDAGRTPRRRAIETRRFCSRRIARARGSTRAATHRWGSQLMAAEHATGTAAHRLVLRMATRTCTRTPRRTRCSRTSRWRRARGHARKQIGIAEPLMVQSDLFRDFFAPAQGLRPPDSATSRVRTLNAQLPRVCGVAARGARRRRSRRHALRRAGAARRSASSLR